MRHSLNRLPQAIFKLVKTETDIDTNGDAKKSHDDGDGSDKNGDRNDVIIDNNDETDGDYYVHDSRNNDD